MHLWELVETDCNLSTKLNKCLNSINQFFTFHFSERCKLPKLQGGVYEKEELFFDHATSVKFLCDAPKSPAPKNPDDPDSKFGEIKCHLGQILPRKPECLHG